MATFELDGPTVRVPLPDGWQADVVDGQVRAWRAAAEGMPLVHVHIRTGSDPRTVLDEELVSLTVGATDYTILHIGSRPVRPANWRGEAPQVPFILGGHRQGVFSVLSEVGVVGGDGSEIALAFALCLAEEAGMIEDELDAILNGIEVDWP